MILYLIKSGVCLLVLFGIYHFVLSSEKMYRFNRYFLLISLVFGLGIPLNTIQETVAVTTENEVTTAPLVFEQPTASFSSVPTYFTLENIFLGIYLTVMLVLLFRFVKNLRSMVVKIYQNHKIVQNNCTFVLTDEKMLPYTFLRYIFINETEFNRNEIESELLEHEKAHARQNHSFDILFIELLQVFFWFQPAIYGFKKALQFNHEFLADEAVLQKAVPTETYQNLILAKITPKKPVPFSSNLAYLVTKKRFIMMTKQTSALKSSLLKLAALPLVALLTVSFSKYEETEIIPPTFVSSNPSAAPIKSESQNQEIPDAEYFAGVRVNVYEKFNGFKGVNLKWSKTYEEFTAEDFKKYGTVFKWARRKPLERKSPTQKELSDFKNSRKYAIWIDGVNVSNSKLNQYKSSDFAHFSGSVILKNARTKKHPQPFQYWFYTHKYFDKTKMGETLKKYPNDTIEFSIDAKSDKTKAEATVVQEEKKPDFPGGMREFMKYFATNFKYPENLKTTETLRLIASFNVTKEGIVDNIKVLKGYSEEIDQEIIRVLKTSPKWIPGEKDGKKIDSEMTIPIQLQVR